MALVFKNPNDGLVTCLPHQIRIFNHFMSEFDTRHCNHNDTFNGVWCDASTGAVTTLRVRACLNGILKSSSSLFKFQQLRHLDLRENNFITSSLPSKLGNLNRLEVLFLPSNGFLGQVPSSFSNLSKLLFVDLSQNELIGSLPHVRNLTNLQILDLSNNHFFGTLSPSSSLFELNNLIYLDLSYNNFSSLLPAEIGNLHRLQVLNLTYNGFFGPVPPTISNLTNLYELRLGHNEFTSSFPLVQNLTRLFGLDMSKNNFVGTIPSSLFAMPSLVYLDLSENHFNGSIRTPNSSTSTKLERLYLGHNLFEGQILEPISKLITLRAFELSFQNISYPIDVRVLSSLSSLSYLDLSGNIISPTSLSSDSYMPLTLRSLFLGDCGIREFPNILKTLVNLKDLVMSSNLMKGKVPGWLQNLPRLRTLDITSNYFNGFGGSEEALVNSSLQVLFFGGNIFQGRLPRLPLSIVAFDATNNSFTGEIPLSICNRSLLSAVNLAYNNFTGPIPKCLNNFTVVDLRENNLEGSIPDVFHVDAPLHTLNVDYNQLSGKLPRSLLNCSSLQFLSVENNQVKDTFPFWLKALPNLQVLNLRLNKFYGPISPPQQGSLGFPELRILHISDNKFTGNLPPSYFANWKSSSLMMNVVGGLYMIYQKAPFKEISYYYVDHMDLRYKGLTVDLANVLTFYSAIDFSGNKLEGHIPESIGHLGTLIALNLSNNAFTGHIPPSLANLNQLESLDLSRNQLSGTIPSGLGTLSFLAYVNMSHNKLNGEIPQGTQITGQPKSCFEGNAGLCGMPLDESCFGTNAPPTQPLTKEEEEEEEEEEQVLSWKAVVIGYGPGLIIGLAIAQIIASCKPEWLVKIIGPIKRRNR